MKLLHIDSSILGPNSITRELSAEIVQRQKAIHPGLEVIYHDLAAHEPKQLSGAHMAAWMGAQVEDEALGQDLAAGAAYADELIAADIVVIGAPMYNFAVPTQLKAWIDRVSLRGKTFRYTAEGKPEGLLSPSKKVLIASARGGVYPPASPADHQESYLMAVLSFLGLVDITIIHAQGVAAGPEMREAAMAHARGEIAALAA
jgi:FMN-dependent NADH-azoreductase